MDSRCRRHVLQNEHRWKRRGGIEQIVKLRRDVLRREGPGIADVAGGGDCIPVVEQHVRRLVQESVAAVPSRIAVGYHPPHRIDGWTTVIDTLDDLKTWLGLANRHDLAVARHCEHLPQ